MKTKTRKGRMAYSGFERVLRLAGCVMYLDARNPDLKIEEKMEENVWHQKICDVQGVRIYNNTDIDKILAVEKIIADEYLNEPTVESVRNELKKVLDEVEGR